MYSVQGKDAKQRETSVDCLVTSHWIILHAASEVCSGSNYFQKTLICGSFFKWEREGASHISNGMALQILAVCQEKIEGLTSVPCHIK